MKLISWNVNGLRAVLKKGFIEFFTSKQPDILCIQETKMQPGQATVDIEGYEEYWNSAERKGYSGTAVFTRLKPLSVSFDLDLGEHPLEGRIITLEFDEFFLVNTYTPNSQRELARLDYRMHWQDDFRSYVQALDEKKPVIICGDLNVAHQEIDLKNPKSNQKNAGFTPQERQKMTELLEAGFTDTFRYKYPEMEGAYTWWTYMFKARERNAGWRIDYFLVSNRIENKIAEAKIYADVMGSDHCPVGLIIQ